MITSDVERGGVMLPKEVNAQIAAEQLVNDFATLNLGNRTMTSPFWMNYDPDLKGTDLHFSVPSGGKKSPEEIRQEASSLIKQTGFDIESANEEEIKMFFMNCGLGVDCSGFSYQIARAVYHSLGGTNFEAGVTNKNGETGIRKINTDSLTCDRNSNPVISVQDIKPGDIIRGANGTHSMVIYGVNGLLLRCAHSCDGVAARGVSLFTINIADASNGIFHQLWSEVNKNGVKYNERLLAISGPNDGVWRLKIIDSLYQSF